MRQNLESSQGLESRSCDPPFEEVERSGCHRACPYPTGKRPRSLRDGARIYMGRLVEEPRDVLIFGVLSV